MTVTDMNLPDLDSSLASIQDLLSSQEQQKPSEADAAAADTGKQLVHYTAQPLFLVDSSAVDVGSGDLPIFFELGEGSYFTDGDEYNEDPTISLLSGTEQPKPKDPTVS
ncbi:heat shock factor protein 1-like [Gallus gallus]|nr:heat shock factor protein 1-like [Gallus gallus]